MVNARAELLMIGVVLVIAVVTTGALVQRLRGEQVQAGSALAVCWGGGARRLRWCARARGSLPCRS